MHSSNKPLKIIAVLFSLIVIGLGTTVLVKNWHEDQMALGRQEAEEDCLEVIRQMEAQLEELRAQLAQQQQELHPERATFAAVFGEEPAKPEDVDCETVQTQLEALYRHLDSQPYMQRHAWTGGSAAFLQECVSSLMTDPPVNIAEMEDLYRLIKNVTHLYKVLGKKRLLLVQEILENESAVLEPSMALFFSRTVDCRQPLGETGRPLSIERFYDYAGFFLNTLGGRSYLLRRDSKVRMLITYYAILLVDRANDEKFNRYGIDIRPHIDYLFFDVSNQKGLAYRERYLARLAALKNKYP